MDLSKRIPMDEDSPGSSLSKRIPMDLSKRIPMDEDSHGSSLSKIIPIYQAYLRASCRQTMRSVQISRPLLRKLIKDTNIHKQYTIFTHVLEEENYKKKTDKTSKVGGPGGGGGGVECHSSGNTEKQRETGTKAEMKETDKFKKLI